MEFESYVTHCFGLRFFFFGCSYSWILFIIVITFTSLVFWNENTVFNLICLSYVVVAEETRRKLRFCMLCTIVCWKGSLVRPSSCVRLTEIGGCFLYWFLFKKILELQVGFYGYYTELFRVLVDIRVL